ncbi:MAG: 4Fe-4S binding protein [Methanosarcinales archaeon]|nr:4Fe-4S binding protein [Methanosarcinales archaeon]
MKDEDKFDFKELVSSLAILIPFWIVAIVLWRSTGDIFYLFNFLYIGAAIGIGIGVYSALPRKKKPLGRRLAMFLIGGYLLFFLGFLNFENLQIEGFFFYLLAGFFSGSVIHYLIAKILGPILFNRAWCSWACWTAMVLDFLPYKRSSGRIPEKWGWLRYTHFILSLSFVLLLWFGLGYRVESKSITELYWLLAGNAIYYSTGIIMAFWLKDNRAFCKYVCPITTILKITTRFSLLKIQGDSEKCNECGACMKTCPMDIQIPDYIKMDSRVLSTECILCQTCVNTCHTGALKVSFGLDIGGKDLLYERKQ